MRSLTDLRDLLRTPLRGPLIQINAFRHGQTTANAEGLVSGVRDVGLTDRGREEAAALAHHLDGRYHAAFHSSLSRSEETLQIALRQSSVDIDAVIGDRRLAERSMGVLEGCPSRPLDPYDRGDLLWAPEDGEPYASVAARVLSFLVDLIGSAQRSGTSLRVVISTHAGPMRILLAAATQATDPRAVLTGRYSNARLSYILLEELSWPPFLEGLR